MLIVFMTSGLTNAEAQTMRAAIVAVQVVGVVKEKEAVPVGAALAAERVMVDTTTAKVTTVPAKARVTEKEAIERYGGCGAMSPVPTLWRMRI